MEVAVLNKLEMVFCILTVGGLLFSALVQNKNTVKTVKIVKEMLFFLMVSSCGAARRLFPNHALYVQLWQSAPI